MKTFIILVIGLIFNSILYSQISFDGGETFYTDSSATTLCNGKYKKYYHGHILKSSLNFLNGKLNGECNEYYEDGIIKTSKHYIDGYLDGIVVEYYQELNVMQSKSHYSKGVLDGESILYDQVGEITNKLFYVNGVLQK
jgi:antitoxin component YwqK of YwqJK toxin-antitoxin module